MRRATLTTCVLAALALSACGGSSSSGLSKAELVKHTTAICASLQSALAQVKRPTDAGDVKLVTRFYERVLPPSEAAITKLRKLEPAKDVKAAWERYVTISGREVAFFEELLVKLKAGHRPDLTAYQALNRQLAAAVAALGVPPKCASV